MWVEINKRLRQDVIVSLMDRPDSVIGTAKHVPNLSGIYFRKIVTIMYISHF